MTKAFVAFSIALSPLLLSSCGFVNFIGIEVNARKIEQLSDELSINVWKDEEQVKEATHSVLDRNQNDVRAYAGAIAPAWSYGGMSVRLAGECGRDGLVHGYTLQANARSKSGVALQVSIAGAGALTAIESPMWKPWLNMPLDEATAASMRQSGAVVLVQCEVGEWTFRLTPGYMLGFEAKMRALHILPPAAD